MTFRLEGAHASLTRQLHHVPLIISGIDIKFATDVVLTRLRRATTSSFVTGFVVGFPIQVDAPTLPTWNIVEVA